MTHHPHIELVDVVCSSCGTHHQVRTTAEALSIDVCSSCHPAYTGSAQVAVGGSRIDRFNHRRAMSRSYSGRR